MKASVASKNKAGTKIETYYDMDNDFQYIAVCVYFKETKSATMIIFRKKYFLFKSFVK